MSPDACSGTAEPPPGRSRVRRPARTGRSDDASPVRCGRAWRPRYSTPRRPIRRIPPRPASGTRGGPRPRIPTTEIVVDHRYRREACGARRFGQLVLPPLALGVLEHLRQRGVADVYGGAAAKMLSRDLRAHRPPPSDWPRPSRDRELRAEDRRVPAPAPLIAALPLPVVPGSVAVGFAVVTSVASSAASLPGEADDGGAALSGNNSARASDSSDNASTRTIGGPSVIGRQTAASHIQTGSFRDTCGSPSTKRSIPSRGPASRAWRRRP